MMSEDEPTDVESTQQREDSPYSTNVTGGCGSLKGVGRIVAGLAKATPPANPRMKWNKWTGDHGLIRDMIEATYPEKFWDLNDWLLTPRGFHRGNKARERIWQVESGKAEFTAPETISALGDEFEGRDELTMATLRPNDQFNTTIYGFSDRLRGLAGREIVLINPEEMSRLGLKEGQAVKLECAIEDGCERVVRGLRLVGYDLPDGCVAACYPEVNPLVPVRYCDELSDTSAYECVPVCIGPDAAAAGTRAAA